MPELSAFQRFALSSDSLRVWGTDTLTHREQRIDRTELIRLVTPDLAALLPDYRAMVREAASEAADDLMHFYSRVVGKDLLKCLRAVASQRGAAYEVNIDRIHRQVAVYAPDLAPLADRLHGLYRAPTANPVPVLRALDEAKTSLLPSLEYP